VSERHQIKDIIALFDQCFAEPFNTRLIKGNDEPIYLPAGATDIDIPAQDFAQVVFAHGYYASALHEIAHWCLAGAERRKKVDFGYWYCPDGRTAAQQAEFQKVEIKPQAIEWGLCIAAGFEFNVSCDNLTGDEFGRQPDHHRFRQLVHDQVDLYLQRGFPPRAQTLMRALSAFYQQAMPVKLEQFPRIKSTSVLECA
jgi:elongation factor P hydroxylase